MSAHERGAFLDLLLDIDATLMDHEEAFRAGTASLHVESGASSALEDFTTRWSAAHERNFDRFLAGEITHDEQRRERVREMFGANLTDAEAERLFGIYVGAYENAWALFDDALQCLDALGSYRLGVISNGQSAQQRAKSTRLGIAGRFAHVTISQDCGAAKPDPKIFRHACERCGIDPGRRGLCWRPLRRRRRGSAARGPDRRLARPHTDSVPAPPDADHPVARGPARARREALARAPCARCTALRYPSR